MDWEVISSGSCIIFRGKTILRQNQSEDGQQREAANGTSVPCRSSRRHDTASRCRRSVCKYKKNKSKTKAIFHSGERFLTFLYPIEGDLKWQAVCVSHVNGKQTPTIFLDALEQNRPLVLGCLVGFATSLTEWEDVHVVALEHVVYGDKNWVRELSRVERLRGLGEGRLTSVEIAIRDVDATARAAFFVSSG